MFVFNNKFIIIQQQQKSLLTQQDSAQRLGSNSSSQGTLNHFGQAKYRAAREPYQYHLV